MKKLINISFIVYLAIVLCITVFRSGFSFSLLIEALQYMFGTGISEIDDFLLVPKCGINELGVIYKNT